VTDVDATRILTEVRRLTELILLCCALCGCARATPSLPALPPGVTPSTVSTEATPVPPSRPRLSVDKAIVVTTMGVVRDDSPEGSASPARCEVRILNHLPAGETREVATLKIDGAPAQHEDILSLLKRKACEAGANAMVIKSMGQTRVEGIEVDHIEAVALIVGSPKPPVDPSPVPKSITVTPDGPALPKTIEVDPGASP
jgi:hypothetical protein